MKVLFMITRDWTHPAASGGDIVPSDYAKYLASKGHQVTMLVSSYPGCARRTVENGVELVRLGGVWTLWLTTMVHYLRSCAGRYDVVVEEAFGGSRIPRLAPLYVRVPIVAEWHQVHRDLIAAQYPRVVRPLLNFLEWACAALHRRTAVRMNTESGRQSLRAIGFDPARVHVVPPGLDEEWIRSLRPIGAKSPTIVWLGKFRRYKAPHHAVEVMTEVVRQVPNARLQLVGRHDDLRYEAFLQQEISRLGLEDSVEFHFQVDESTKAQLLTDAAVMVITSAIEGFGLVALEANACGTPIVASSGVPVEVVRDGDNGFRYPFADRSSLAEKLILVLQGGTEIDAMATRASQWARSQTVSVCASQYEQVLADVIQRSKRFVA